MSRDMLHVTHNTSHVTQRGWWTLSQNFRLVAPTVWEKLCFKYLEWNAVIPLTHSPKVASLSKEELRATTQGGRQGAEKEVLYSIVLSVCIKLRSRILGSSEITKTNEVNLHSFCFDSFLKWLKFVKFSIKFLTLIAEEKCKYNRLYNCEFYCVWLGLCGVRPSALRLAISKIGSNSGTVPHNTFWHHITQHILALYHTTHSGTVPHNIFWHRTTQHILALYHTTHSGTVPHNTFWHHSTQHILAP